LLLRPCEFQYRFSIGISIRIQVVAGANSCNGIPLFELCKNGRLEAGAIRVFDFWIR